jgi:tetratricopeptide (TPR) repeat protein
VAIETARRWPHFAHDHLYPLLAAHPHLAVAAGGAALAGLAALPGIDPALLEAIDTHLPHDRHTDLDTGIAALAQHLADHRLASTPDPADHAHIHHSLAIRLSNAGLYHQAHTAAQQAVELHRRLAAADPAYRPALAMSLSNLGVMLSNLGRREEALSTTRDAVEVYRRLAQTNPAAHEPDLARSLGTAAWIRVALRTELVEALGSISESVATYQRLAAQVPGAFIADLRSALGTAANVLDGLARPQDASTLRRLTKAGTLGEAADFLQETALS